VTTPSAGRGAAEIARVDLVEPVYAEGFARRASRAIAEHGTNLGPLPPDKQGEVLPFEGKGLIQADILDRLGANAVTGALLDLGKGGKLSHECRAAMAQGVVMERATLFKDYVWTETGTRLAAERYLVFVDFLKQLAEEVDDAQDPCGSA
jgi:hypothetical protein